MKIADKGPVDINLPQLVKDNQAVSPTRDRGDKKEVERGGETTKVSISAEARQLQRVAPRSWGVSSMRNRARRRLALALVRALHNGLD